VENVFGSVIFYSSFPASESVEGDSAQSWILEFNRNSLSLLTVVVSVMVKRLPLVPEYSLSAVSGRDIKHAYELFAHA